jgi:scyllo-inositol 2-dehydrogenase (NADP+)
MVDVGLVGFGLGGRAFHAPIIFQVAGLRLAAILQRSGNSSQQAYSNVRVVRDLDELLGINSISLVAISTPNETHFPFAKKFLEAGRHVVVDKPFTTTLQEAHELVALAKKTGRILTVYQDRRFDGDFRTLQKMVADETLGRIVNFQVTFDRCRPVINTKTWKEKPVLGSGVFFDLGPHLIDQTLVLMGEPEQVLADIRSEREGSVTPDAFDLTFFYKDRARAELNVSTLAPDPRPHFRVQGTKGVYLKQGLDPQEALLRADHPATGEDWGLEPESDWGTLILWQGGELKREKVPTLRGDYRVFYAQVRDAILGKAQPPVSCTEALRVMYALELCLQSSKKRAALPWAFRAT